MHPSRRAGVRGRRRRRAQDPARLRARGDLQRASVPRRAAGPADPRSHRARGRGAGAGAGPLARAHADLETSAGAGERSGGVMSAPGKKTGDSGVATEVEKKTKQKLQRPKLYKVLLLNDDYTTMEFVVALLIHVF